METVGRQVAVRLGVKPGAVGRNAIGRVEAQAAEDVRCDFGAFLWRGGGQRMQAGECRRQYLEHAELPRNVRDAPVGLAGRRAWIDSFVHCRRAIVGILQHHAMQEGGAAARQAGDEDRPPDRLLDDVRPGTLGRAQRQQIGEETQHVPAGGEPANRAQRRFIGAGLQQAPQWLGEIHIAEILHPARRRAVPMISSIANGRPSSPKAPATVSAESERGSGDGQCGRLPSAWQAMLTCR